jgi:F0F1-type ATP synthase membrane subunit c/vacuolar-type H+-ATPase subunit K
MSEAPLTPQQSAAAARRFFWSGIAVLVCGLAAAVAVYISAVDNTNEALAEEMARGKQYDFQLERLGGKAMVLTAQFNDWFSSLWHGKPLAYLLAGASLAVGLGCLWVARRLKTVARESVEQ